MLLLIFCFNLFYLNKKVEKTYINNDIILNVRSDKLEGTAFGSTANAGLH